MIKRRFVRGTLFLFLVLFWAECAAAQETRRQTPLTLDEVLRQVDVAYPKIIGGQQEVEAATAKRVSKQGAFDLLAGAESGYQRFNSTTTRGKPVSATVSEGGVELLTRSGLKFSAGNRLNVGSVKAPDSSTGTLGEWYVGLKMPLLRGLGMNEKSAAERQALLGEPLAERNFAVNRLNIRLAAATAYFDWGAAGQKLRVAQDVRELARVRAAQIARRVKAGDLRPIDNVEARAEVERRDGAVIKAERDVQKAAFKLGLYMWQDDGAEPPPNSLLPPALPLPQDLEEAQIAAARNAALLNRPEIGGIALSRQIVRVDEQLAENDRKPSVDLILNPGRDFGGRSIGETMKFGLAFALPLNRREATGRRDEARLKQAKLDQDETLLRAQVVTEVNDAANAVTTAKDRYDAAVREVALTRELEQGERRLFDAGESTLFLLNQRERATAEALGRLYDVQAEYSQALAAFRASQAVL